MNMTYSAEIKRIILDEFGRIEDIEETCRQFSIARSTFYRARHAFEKFENDGILPSKRQKSRIPNTLADDVIEKIILATKRFPSAS